MYGMMTDDAEAKMPKTSIDAQHVQLLFSRPLSDEATRTTHLLFKTGCNSEGHEAFAVDDLEGFGS